MSGRGTVVWLCHPERDAQDIAEHLADLGYENLPRRHVVAICERLRMRWRGWTDFTQCDSRIAVCPVIRGEAWIIEIPGCVMQKSSPWVEVASVVEKITGLRLMSIERFALDFPIQCRQVIDEAKRDAVPVLCGGNSGQVEYFFLRDLYHSIPREALPKSACYYCGFTSGFYLQFHESRYNKGKAHEKCSQYAEWAQKFGVQVLSERHRCLVDELVKREYQLSRIEAALGDARRNHERAQRRYRSMTDIDRRSAETRFTKLMSLMLDRHRDVKHLRRRLDAAHTAFINMRLYKQEAEESALVEAKHKFKLIKKALARPERLIEILSSQTEAR